MISLHPAEAPAAVEPETPAVTETHVLAVIDKSGSMDNLAGDVRGGFNSYLEELRDDLQMQYTVTVVLFDTEVTVLAVDVPLAEAPKLDEVNYRTIGSTALNDGIMTAVLRFQERHAELGDSERAILVVNTDGRENASREHTAREVHAKLDQLKATGKWATLFMGSGPDAWQAGLQFGADTVAITRSAVGTRSSYSAAAAATRAYSAGASAAETFSVAEKTVSDLGGSAN